MLNGNTKVRLATYLIKTYMGKVLTNDYSYKVLASFLSEEEIIQLHSIGYSGHDVQGNRTTREDYLNTLGKGMFKVTQTTYDNASFMEDFIITRAYIEDDGSIDTVDPEKTLAELLMPVLDDYYGDHRTSDHKQEIIDLIETRFSDILTILAGLKENYL